MPQTQPGSSQREAQGARQHWCARDPSATTESGIQGCVCGTPPSSRSHAHFAQREHEQEFGEFQSGDHKPRWPLGFETRFQLHNTSYCTERLHFLRRVFCALSSRKMKSPLSKSSLYGGLISRSHALRYTVLKGVAGCGHVWPCVAACCGVLQCVAVCHMVW